MRSDVADDSTVIFLIEEPGWAGVDVHPVRSESYGLYDFPDSAGLHQFTGLYCRPVLEAFTIHDRVYAASLFLHPSHFFQLFEGDDAGFVSHEIFTVLHCADTEDRKSTRLNSSHVK